MKPFYFINTKIARIITYIIVIGGLFYFCAAIIWFAWNIIISKVFVSSDINILEAAGIASFSYIIYYSIKYGNKKEKADNLSCKKMPISHKYDKNSEPIINPYYSGLSEKEKNEIKQTMNTIAFTNNKFKNIKNNNLTNQNPHYN